MYMEIRIKHINWQHNILTFIEPGTLVNRISFQKSKISLKLEQWFTYKNISIHNQ